MRKTLLLILFLCFTYALQAQNSSNTYKIIRSSLGVGGSLNVVETSKGKYSVSQSIGQSSVIGTYANKGFSLRQGYQQPLQKIKVKTQSNSNFNASIFPNPFLESISISFVEKLSDDINISLFDINGRLIYSKIYNPMITINLKLNDISRGSYLLKISSGNKLLNAKLIKK